MTAVVADLYRTVVLEHGKHPRNRGLLARPTHAAEGDNPLCGDALRIEIELVGDELRALGFTGESCAIATASASLMTERLAGRTRDDARRLADAMESLCTTGGRNDRASKDELGDLMVFAAVHRHPVRVGCATLAWRVLRRVLPV